MKILWISNVMLGAVAESLDGTVPSVGGWLAGLSGELLKDSDISLVSCFPYKSILDGKCGKITYYGFKLHTDSTAYFCEILRKENPDIIHIFGTEYPHSYQMICAAEKCDYLSRTIISIQGLAHFYSKKYISGLPLKTIYSITLRTIIKHDSINTKMKEMAKNGQYEIRALEKCQNVIGRTEWDYACVKSINPSIKYFHCDETLRQSFYHDTWNIDKCERYSIFVSQANYPIKGFHYIIEALSYLIKFYPNVKLYTTGYDLLRNDINYIIRQSSYQKYLRKLIKKYGLENNISFLGTLSEHEMKDMFLKAHVFISPSLLENSPNSVGEAMILGVPVVSSDVGGVKSMLTHNLEGFIYPYDEPYMAAYYIHKIFGDDSLANKLSKLAREKALVTHDPQKNNTELREIYKSVQLSRNHQINANIQIDVHLLTRNEKSF